MKKILKKIKESLKKWVNSLKVMRWYQRMIYSIIMLALIILQINLLQQHWAFVFLYPAIWLIFNLYILYVNGKFLGNTEGNGIIYGNRRKGKGILAQLKANSQHRLYSNVPFTPRTEHVEMLEYFNSIGSNTILDTINGTVKKIKKLDKFEGVNVIFDDINVYAPNFEDSLLKKMYPSAPLVLAINGHLYDHYTIIISQAKERPYKPLKELQEDFFVKALKTIGFQKKKKKANGKTYLKGWLWNSIPYLRSFVSTSYRYYEEPKGAESGVLPFKAVGLVNEAMKHGYLTGGQATKEQFEATYGKVYESRIWIKKKRITYDTRFFHELFYGYKAN